MAETVASRERILAAAELEFANHGYAGARMERIARQAAVNKAMLFYYFASKENLYRTVLGRMLGLFFAAMAPLVTDPQLTPSRLVETFPAMYINFLRRHPHFIKIMALDLIQNPQNVVRAVDAAVRQQPQAAPPPLIARLREWHRQGLIREADPFHFMMNMVALSIFSFIGRPVVETISGLKAKNETQFYRQRITSIVSLLKRGMLR